MTGQSLILKPFGKTARNVTVVGLGGEGILRTYGRESSAVTLIESALAEGITYFDSARVYAGSETYYGLLWSHRPEDRAKVFQASKSASRHKEAALMDLERTLNNMKTDHLDLWQIHDVRTEEDFRIIEGPGGALEAFLEAKAQGKTRFIGVTGHHDPAILTRAVKEWPVDAVMMPVNPVEGVLGGFLDSTLPSALEKGMAVIGMKVLGASHYLLPENGVTVEMLIRFSLSQPITVAIVGCSTPEEVKTLARVGRTLQPMSSEEQQQVMRLFSPYAKGLAYYRGVT